MSTSEQDELESSDSEELVAYLDGELPPEVSRQVEERLAGDADYREQLQELDRAWEALDALPRTSVDDDFARTTIEMVALAAQRDLGERTNEAAHATRSRRLRWAAIAAVAAAAGFAVASFLLPNKDKQLLADLSVIRQYDLLTQITDIGFLRELSKRVPADQLTRDIAAKEIEVEAIRTISAANPEKRKQWVEALLPDEKQDLWAQEDRFYACTPEEQQRLRNLAGEIARDPDVEQLQKTLVAYGDWLASKRENDRYKFRKKVVPTAERIAMIEELVREEGRRLSDAEKRNLKTAVRAITEEHKEAILKAYTQGGGDAERLRKSFEQHSVALELITVFWALNNEETSANTRKQLVEQLDLETQKSLATREEPRRGGRPRDQLSGWIYESMRPRRDHTPAELLMRFFSQDLTNEERKSLSELSPADFEARLAEWYDTKMMMDPALGDLEARTGIRPFGGRQGGRGEGPRGGRGRRGGPPGPDGFPQFGPEGERGPRGGNDRGERDERGRGGRQREGRNDNRPEDARRDEQRGNRKDNQEAGKRPVDNAGGAAPDKRGN
jgi:hypothetical protein